MIYIDVRTPDEYNQAHVPGAINFDLAEMMLGELPDVAQDAEITLYCRSGGRAQNALDIMQKAGFTNVKNGGGYSDLV
jgi:phage shock protein E